MQKRAVEWHLSFFSAAETLGLAQQTEHILVCHIFRIRIITNDLLQCNKKSIWFIIRYRTLFRIRFLWTNVQWICQQSLSILSILFVGYCFFDFSYHLSISWSIGTDNHKSQKHLKSKKAPKHLDSVFFLNLYPSQSVRLLTFPHFRPFPFSLLPIWRTNFYRPTRKPNKWYKFKLVEFK